MSLTYPATNNKQAIDLNIDSANRWRQILTGDINTTVETFEGGGNVPSVAKAIADLAAYKSPIAWNEGSNETDILQPRTFNNFVFVPIRVPAPMGAIPNDFYWKAYLQSVDDISPDTGYNVYSETISGADKDTFDLPWQYDSVEGNLFVWVNGTKLTQDSLTFVDDDTVTISPAATDGQVVEIASFTLAAYSIVLGLKDEARQAATDAELAAAKLSSNIHEETLNIGTEYVDLPFYVDAAIRNFFVVLDGITQSNGSITPVNSSNIEITTGPCNRLKLGGPIEQEMDIMVISSLSTALGDVADAIAEYTSGVKVTVDTIADLRNLTPLPGASVDVLGYYERGDGGGGPLRVWKTGGAYVDNGGSVITPGGVPGPDAWVFEPIEVITEEFGAFPDGSDVVSRIENAVQSGAKTLRIGSGTYRLNSPLNFGGINVKGKGTSNTIFEFYGTGQAVTWSGNGTELSGFAVKSKGTGQSGVLVPGGTGPSISRIAVYDFDGVSFQLGVAGSGGAYFADVNYIECNNPNTVGTKGFVIDGLVIPNSNANVCKNIFVKGIFQTYYNIKGNKNIFIGGDAEPNNSTGAVNEVFNIEGIGNEFYGPYIEPVIAGPDKYIRFGSNAQSNKFHSIYWTSAGSNPYSKIEDLGTNNDVHISPNGFNSPQSAGDNISYENLVRNSGFYGVKSDGLPVGWVKSGTGTISRDASIVRGSKYSMKLDVNSSAVTLNSFISTNNPGAPTRLPLETIPVARLRGKTINAGVWCYSTQQGLGGLKVTNGDTTVGSSEHSGSGTWEFLAASVRVKDDATEVSIQFRTDLDNLPRTGICYFSEPVLVLGNKLPQSVQSRALDDGDAVLAGRLVWNQIIKLQENSPTPDVRDSNFFSEENTLSTRITNFLNAKSGQEIKIRTTTANTTLGQNSNLQTTTGADKVLSPNTVYKLIYDGTKWYEF